MNYTSLVDYIRAQGCRVRLYNKRLVNEAKGTFHVTERGPLISIAMKGNNNKKAVEYLLHEYGHYLQWQDGYMDLLDGICDGYELWHQWVKGQIELTALEIKTARNAMLALEWGAECRALALGERLKIKHFDYEHHLKGANAYMLGIKWQWAARANYKASPKRKGLRPRMLTEAQLFAPLTRKEKDYLLKNKFSITF